VLGKSYFKDNIEQMINLRVAPDKPGRPKINEGEVYYYVYQWKLFLDAVIK
jgi:hypothetical protein